MSSAALPRDTASPRSASAPDRGAPGALDVPIGTRFVRAATVCLAFHAALSLFSAVAFATFLTGPPPAWLAEPANARALQIGWTFGPATTVVLGALAGLLHAAGRLGPRRAGLIFIFGFLISLSAELSGTHTGYPFGPYGYSGLLGYKILGLVPFNIPTSWFFMLYCSLAICGRLLAARDDAGSRWGWAVVAGFVLTAWDVSMDPAMVRTAHWTWHLTTGAQQTAMQRWFVSDLFYGMPLSNWLGWLLTGTIVARVMLAIVPPSAWARRVSTTNFPLVLYAVNGVLPITICARHGMTWAAALGALAMGIPLALAVRAGLRTAPVREAATMPATAAA
ncbi:MAG TPA: carotenoid biosynthesis protein [Gemmatirosa sp.]